MIMVHSLRTLLTKDEGFQVIDGAAEDTANRLFRDLPVGLCRSGESACVNARSELVDLRKATVGRSGRYYGAQ